MPTNNQDFKFELDPRTFNLATGTTTVYQGDLTKYFLSGIGVTTMLYPCDIVNFIGVGNTGYPINPNIDVMSGVNRPVRQGVKFSGVFEFLTTAGDSLYPYDAVIMGATAQTVTNTNNKPAAPALTAPGSGTGPVSGNYYGYTTYFGDGWETERSLVSAVLAHDGNAITFTVAAVPAALLSGDDICKGYRCYLTKVGAAIPYLIGTIESGTTTLTTASATPWATGLIIPPRHNGLAVGYVIQDTGLSYPITGASGTKILVGINRNLRRFGVI